MKKLHLALATDDIARSVKEYSQRFECEPCCIVPGEYALWRTETLNVSIRYDSSQVPGSLRHLGWEDPNAPNFSHDVDCNGILWERFNARQQAEEIKTAWPKTDYAPEG